MKEKFLVILKLNKNDIDNKNMPIDTCVNVDIKTIAFIQNNDLFIIHEGDENVPSYKVFGGASGVQKIQTFKNIFVALYSNDLYFFGNSNNCVKMINNITDFKISNKILYFIHENIIYKYPSNSLNFILCASGGTVDVPPTYWCSRENEEVSLHKDAEPVYVRNRMLAPKFFIIESEILKVVLSNNTTIEI